MGHREIQLAASRESLIENQKIYQTDVMFTAYCAKRPEPVEGLTACRPLKRFVAIELLGEGVDCVGIVITSVIVKKDFLLLLGILGPSPAMRPEKIGHAGNGIGVVKKIDPAVAIAVPTIVFDIRGQELRNANSTLTGPKNCERINVVFVGIAKYSLQFPVASGSSLG